MGETVDLIRDRGLVAVVSAPVEERLFDWAIAVAKGGIRLLGIPVTFPQVTEVTSDLGDEAGLSVGVSGVVSPEQVSIALAAGADFILSPVCNTEIIEAARGRGLTVVAGAATPTEILRCVEAGADLVALFPATALGGPTMVETVLGQMPSVPVLAAGGVDVENAPAYLEAGAIGTVVDRGVFPMDEDPAAVEVITARATALVEVCDEVLGRPHRESLTDVLTNRPPSPEGDEA